MSLVWPDSLVFYSQKIIFEKSSQFVLNLTELPENSLTVVLDEVGFSWLYNALFSV